MKSSSRQTRSLLFPTLALILLATGALWFFFNRDTPQPPPQSSVSSGKIQVDPATALSPEITEPPAPAPLPEQPSAAEAPGGLIKEQTAPTSSTLPTKKNLPQARERLLEFYHSLDQQKYIQARHLDVPSHIFFTRLIQKAVETPPVVTRETDDLLTILKNSAHFFRLLGKDNILLIKEILNQEQDKIEEVMASYFLLSEQPDTLHNELSLKIPDNALYEYACFFLNTMGGRLYLSRRDSRMRMLVTYYAIQIIEQANLKEKNQYGLQLQPAIDLLTAEMETGGHHLRYQGAYLDTLYDLKEKYQPR